MLPPRWLADGVGRCTWGLGCFLRCYFLLLQSLLLLLLLCLLLLLQQVLLQL